MNRFLDRIGKVTVRLIDVNGPRGGNDKRCGVVLDLKGCGVVVLEEDGADLDSVIDRAADRVGRVVSRRVRFSALRRRAPKGDRYPARGRTGGNGAAPRKDTREKSDADVA